MYTAFAEHNVLPNQFRQISSADWNMLKSIHTTKNEKLKILKEQELEKARVKAEMQNRLSMR